MPRLPYHSTAELYPQEPEDGCRKPKNPFDAPTDHGAATGGDDFFKFGIKTRDNGYSPLPIKGGTKQPALLAWSDRCVKPMSDAELRLSNRPGVGLGVACGYNNLIILDIDTDDPKIQKMIARVLPKTPVMRKGRKGFGLFFRFEGGEAPSFSLSAKDGERLIDVLGFGRQSIVPPTIHPETGKPYTWEGEGSIFNKSVFELPILTQGHLDALKEVLRPNLRERPSWSAEDLAKYRAVASGHKFTDEDRRRYCGFVSAGMTARAKEIDQTPSGNRNSALYAAVCYFGKFLHHGFISEQQFIEPLVSACRRNGLVKEDGLNAVMATVRSGLLISRNDPIIELVERPNPNAERPSIAVEDPDDPISLVLPVAASDPFPVDSLGPILSGMTRALHEAAVQSPLAICGTSVLAGAALATQGHRDIVLPVSGGLSSPISCYFLSIALSGERKSATDNAALRPVREREEELSSAYKNEYADYVNAIEAWTAQRKHINNARKGTWQDRKSQLDRLGSEPRKPLSPILRCSEPTLEGLTNHLKSGIPSIGIFSSEGGQFIGGHAMSDDAKRRSAAALNSVWDNGAFERIRAEGAVILRGRRVSVFLQAQPEVAAAFLNDPILNDIGLLARFMICQPDSAMGFRKIRDLSSEHQMAVADYSAAMLRLLTRQLPYREDGDGLAPIPLVFSEAAARAFRELDAHKEAELRPNGRFRPISGFANKLPEHASRVAAVIQTLHDPEASELSEEWFARGSTIALWFAGEMLRVKEAAKVTSELADANELLKWLQQGWKEQHVCIQAICQFVPTKRFRLAADAKRLVTILADHGWLLPSPGAVVSGKQRKDAWRIVRRAA
jgi:hypothetical protein